MTDIFWPETLPQTLLLEGLSAKQRSNVIRTTMDAGAQKTRRRYTATTKIFTGKMLLNEEQRFILAQFFHTALADGALRFNFTDPQTLETAEFRFTEEPAEVSASDMWEIQMSLERL